MTSTTDAVARLAFVRTLRELGLDRPTILKVVDWKLSLPEDDEEAGVDDHRGRTPNQVPSRSARSAATGRAPEASQLPAACVQACMLSAVTNWRMDLRCPGDRGTGKLKEQGTADAELAGEAWRSERQRDLL